MTAITIHIQEKIYPAPHAKQTPHHAISELKLHIKAHEFVCLVGPSGCGKTTLLNILAGLDASFKGSIHTDHAREPDIAYVFQNPRLLPWHTLRENIELAAPDLQTDVLDDFLDIMQLTGAQHTYPAHLSLGMSRRAAIIRGFAINPELLLMDEPLVSLDAPTARTVRELLITLWQQRPHTILFVTHDLREAIRLADRLVFLSPPPMQVIHSVPIEKNQTQRNDEFVDQFRQDLVNQHTIIRQHL